MHYVLNAVVSLSHRVVFSRECIHRMMHSRHAFSMRRLLRRNFVVCRSSSCVHFKCFFFVRDWQTHNFLFFQLAKDTLYLLFMNHVFATWQGKFGIVVILCLQVKKTNFGDGQTELLQVFNFAILSYLQNSQKFDACEKCVLQ